jgi:hypothetical protein
VCLCCFETISSPCSASEEHGFADQRYVNCRGTLGDSNFGDRLAALGQALACHGASLKSRGVLYRHAVHLPNNLGVS